MVLVNVMQLIKKKQEFSGGSIIIDNSTCLNFNNKDLVDKYSTIQIKNK